MDTNQIDTTARINPNVILGNYNRIGKNVVIDILGENPNVEAYIGDNNIINDNTRIIINGELKIGDWNVFHNDMLVMADDHVIIGHNCWFGQNTILDGAGGLEIGDGVRVGMYSQIWTHVASGEQIEGCVFYSKRKTIIESDVWLVGSCVVGSGLTLGKRSTILINSVITKNTLPDTAYSGSPAKAMDNLKVYLPKSLDEKFDMMKSWVREFVSLNESLYKFTCNDDAISLVNLVNNEYVNFTKSSNEKVRDGQSVFSLLDKTFVKTNSQTERAIYKFLYGNKARFLPIQ